MERIFAILAAFITGGMGMAMSFAHIAEAATVLN
jgi:hypothetical protein